MNDTVLALLSALAIYGLASFALPRGGSGGDDDPVIQMEDRGDVPPAKDFDEDGPRTS